MLKNTATNKVIGAVSFQRIVGDNTNNGTAKTQSPTNRQKQTHLILVDTVSIFAPDEKMFSRCFLFKLAAGFFFL
jgi:hypothetical protein